MRVCWAALLMTLLIAPSAVRAEDTPAAPPPPIEDRWDFYFARINDADASVLLNMALKPHAPIATQPRLVWVLLDMKTPDRHRMGTPDEVARLMKVERAVTERLETAMGARNVARIRGEGLWQLYYYAPSDKGLQEHVKRALSRHSGQTFEAGSKPDPKWSYFTGFLWPSPERLRWIKDRRVVDRLQTSGDLLTVPRDVAHWAYFPDAAKRTDFETKIAAKKFVVDERVELLDDKNPLLVRFHRSDRVELAHIHTVTEFLRKAATEAGGEYDGWETPVVKTKPPEKKKPAKDVK